MSEGVLPVTLRPARAQDGAQAGPLIYSAGPALFSAMFGPREADVVRFFEALFRLPRNPFSHENATVAVEEGRVVGLAIAADAAGRRRVGRRMLWLAPRLRGPFALLRRFPAVLEIMACTGAPPPGAFYLSILAVAPDRQGRGLGSLLLAEVRRQAEAAGSPCVVLHTETTNATAQRLYARHGYVETHRHEVKNPARFGVAGFVMMECPLPAPGPGQSLEHAQDRG